MNSSWRCINDQARAETMKVVTKCIDEQASSRWTEQVASQSVEEYHALWSYVSVESFLVETYWKGHLFSAVVKFILLALIEITTNLGDDFAKNG